MSRWRVRNSIWGAVAGTTLALGIVCALVLWGLWVTAAAVLGFFVPAFFGAVLLEKSTWASIRIGTRFGVVSAACAGLLAAFAWSGLLLLVVVTVSSPFVRILLRPARLTTLMWPAQPRDGAAAPGDRRSFDARRAASRDGGESSMRTLVPLPDIPDADGVPGLDDCALCEAWRRSYVRLDRSRAAEARLEVVRLRQVYLDELVRRHPAEVRRWLASGARAAGNPLPFLTRSHGRDDVTTEDDRLDSGGSEVA